MEALFFMPTQFRILNSAPYHVKCEYCSASIKEVKTEKETYAGGVCDECKAKGLGYGASNSSGVRVEMEKVDTKTGELKKYEADVVSERDAKHAGQQTCEKCHKKFDGPYGTEKVCQDCRLENSAKCAFAESGSPCDGAISSITEPDGSITKSCQKHLHTATNATCQQCGGKGYGETKSGGREKCEFCEGTGSNLENSGAWPTALKCSFIEPGVVMYADVGMVLVQKPALDKMANSMRGKPVINVDHRDVSPDDFKNGNFDGIVDGNDHAVWFDPADAKFHCSFQITTPATLQNIKNGFKVSCAYRVTKWGPGGIHNNVPYEREVLDGEYTHLAIVANPRYEGVRIYNTKGAKTMTLQWIKKLLGADGKTMENSIDIDSSKSVIEVGGKEYTLDNAIEALKAQEAAKDKELANKGPADDHIVDVPGIGKRTVKQLKDAIALQNAEDDKDAEDKKRKEDDEEAKKTERSNAEEKEKVEKDHEDGKHDDDEKKNCAMCNKRKNSNGRAHFARVEELANSRNGELVNDLEEPIDGFAIGRQRFGSEEPAAKK
jgi:hypothetical protein